MTAHGSEFHIVDFQVSKYFTDFISINKVPDNVLVCLDFCGRISLAVVLCLSLLGNIKFYFSSRLNKDNFIYES